MAIVINKPDLKVKQIKTHSLSAYSYIIESDKEVAVIDPLRDVKPYTDFIHDTHSKCKWVLSTQYHSDFVSGCCDLASKAHAKLMFGPDSHPEFNCRVGHNNDSITVGNHIITLLHTPGHTVESTCYLLSDGEKKPIAIFTGDTLYLGDVGRPDTVQIASTTTVASMAKYLFKSLKVLQGLPDDVMVLPGHGSGFGWAKTIAVGDRSTIGEQRQSNKLFTEADEQTFISAVTEDLPHYPAYFSLVTHINKHGNMKSIDDVVNSSFKAFTAEKFKELAEDPHSFIIDCRFPGNFVQGAIPGSISIPIDVQFGIWTANVIDPRKGDKILLVAPEGREREAINNLARTGLDNVVGFLEGGYENWVSHHFPVEKLDNQEFATKEDFAKATEGAKVLDVRSYSDWKTGVLKSATLINLANVRAAAESSKDKAAKIFIHSKKTGGRSVLAASLLKRLGFTNVHHIAGGVDALKLKGVEFVAATQTSAETF